jgi:hypothetical protein
MKIGLFLALFADRPLDEALDAATAAGCEAVELVSTASSPHCRPAELLADAKAGAQLATAVSSRGLALSALSCHGNPLHHHVLRLPRRVRAVAAPELGDVLLARRLPRDPRVAVARARPPLLGRGGGVRPRAGCAHRDRAPSGLRRLQHRLDAAPARGSGRRGRRELRSVPSLLAADGSDRVRAGARRRDLPRPRQGHGLRRRAARGQRRPRDRAPTLGASVDLPLGRGGASRLLLARPDRSAARGRLRGSALDRARGSAPLARRGPPTRRLDAAEALA